jgi:dolichol-phosphate mannosyltransferase
LDGDLQHPPELIAEMVRRWREEGALIVEAVKKRRAAEPLLNKLGAKAFYSLFKMTSGINLYGASDFKLLDRRVIRAWASLGERNTFFRGMSAWIGFPRSTVEFEVAARGNGASRWSRWRLMRLAITAITSFSSAPLHLVSLTGGAFLIFALILGIHSLYMKLSGRALDGFTTVNLLILIASGAMMIALGIIGEYLARIYDELKGRPRYLVREVSPDDVKE